MKRRKIFFMIFTGVISMIFLFGCGKQKYQLNFEGYGFESKKTEYAAGEKVTVYFSNIGTDTDYKFFLDDKSVELKQKYNDKHGYILTFTMPDHDVTLNVEAHNSMGSFLRFKVNFINEAEEADIWILPQTEYNMKTTVWGRATIEELPVGEKKLVYLQETGETNKWIINIVSGHQHYSVSDITLHEEDTICFRSETREVNGIQTEVESIEILDPDGNSVYKNEDIFVGTFGAE